MKPLDGCAKARNGVGRSVTTKHNFVTLACVWELSLSHDEGAAAVIVNLPHPGSYLDDVCAYCLHRHAAVTVHPAFLSVMMGESAENGVCDCV